MPDYHIREILDELVCEIRQVDKIQNADEHTRAVMDLLEKYEEKIKKERD